MLYQGKTTVNETLVITNMTNSALSASAIDAISEEMLDVEGIDGVTVTIDEDYDDFTSFNVYETDSNNNYLFSVDNDGTVYNK